MEEFDIWLNDFHEHYKNSKSWQEVQRYNPNVKDLLSWYIQYKNGQDSKSLVKATWTLTIATIILSGLTLILSGLTLYFQYIG